ncbi:MAG: class I SAM-dependent methyltransferase [Bacteroidetes bacterium]|nr:class I SAM-dependent methyltransferase [Bacteroidota bacterium]
MKILRSLQLIIDFAEYYISATNRHGLQGPFAYQLNEAVFRHDRREAVHKEIEATRDHLLQNHRKINVLDFGAGFGGKVYKERAISYITKNSSKPPRYARMLYRLVNHLKPKLMLELGTSVGISALYQSAGNPQGRMITMEGCPETAALARASVQQFPSLNIEIVEGAFEESLPQLLTKIDQIDYLFIDGHHRLEPTLNYINLCYPKLSADAVIVVDDINWSPEMQEAWKQLKADKRFTLSIDVFMIGLLFVNKNLSKEDFVIRY